MSANCLEYIMMLRFYVFKGFKLIKMPQKYNKPEETFQVCIFFFTSHCVCASVKVST